MKENKEGHNADVIAGYRDFLRQAIPLYRTRRLAYDHILQDREWGVRLTAAGLSLEEQMALVEEQMASHT